ncbi:PKD domain-containing protein [Nocardioides caldifontis]|uniref:PKD domain-containing protein n=1 Tax=Nocardioides caldifontis TaxID=2588938 RepID=UPI0011E01975|nr:PKD domain-containing protein [Nocardioides caldifontis]
MSHPSHPRVSLALLTAFLLALSLGSVTAPAASAAVHVDDTPEPAWQVDGTVYATLVVGDTVYVGGQFRTLLGTGGATLARQNLAAFSLATGAPLADFSANASGGPVRSLLSDGTSLWAGGSFTSIGGVARGKVARLSLATGAVDATFNPAPNDTVRAMALDGRSLYLGGAFTTVGTTTRNRVAKVDATTGTVDPAFNANANNNVFGLALDAANRRLYLAGNFATVGGVSRNGMARVDAATGALASTVFASAARPTLDLELAPDGSRLFAAGGGTNAAGSWNTATGARQWRQTANGDIQAVELHDGTVYFGFHDGFQGDTTIKLLAADATTGALDPGFRPTFDQFWGVWALDASDAGLVVGGDFTTVSKVPARGLALFPRVGGGSPTTEQLQWVDSTTTWKYWDGGTRPTGWHTTTFDDSGWRTGRPQLGYGDGDEETVIGFGPSTTSRYLTSYFRTTFDVTRLGDEVEMLLAADDGAVVYVNGVEAFRDNMPTGTIGNTTRASTGRSGGGENEMRTFALDPSLFGLGPNTIAVELHQDTASSSDATFDADVTAHVQPSADTPPTAAFTAGVDRLTVALDADGSADAEGPIASYQWNFGDGTTETSTSPTTSHTYATEGSYTVTLRVTDGAGNVGTAVRTVAPTSGSVTTTAIANGSSWSYRYSTTAPEATWTQTAFDASAWATGNAVLGYGHSSVVTDLAPSATTTDRPVAAQFRRSFTVADPTKVAGLRLTTVANDGVVVYVNGVEVARSGMPTGTVTHTTYATASPSTAVANAAPVVVEVPVGLLASGTNVVAVESHVRFRGSTDLTFDLRAELTSLR